MDRQPGEYPNEITINLNFDTTRKIEIIGTFSDLKKNVTSTSVTIQKTTAIYIRVYEKNKLIDSVFAGTYIIGKKSLLPVVCLNLKRENFDLPDGILTGGIETAKAEDSSVVTFGRIWKKESIPVFVEYYEKGKEPYYGIHRVKPFGGMTISMPERSIRLITDTTIGPKKIKISPFTNKKFKSYKSIVLRTSGNDQAMTRIKDITLSSIARDLNLDYMDYRQAVLYVNGEYWGIYNMREKVNLEYLKYNHGAIKDPKLTTVDITGINIPEYQQMLEYVRRPFPEKVVIDSINRKIVFDNYIDYIILQIHTINVDSRGNVRFWKSKSLDNRWRWIYFDGDQSCFPYQINFNYLQKRLSPVETEWCNPEWVTVTLRSLLSHTETKNFFINEYCFLLGTRMHKDTLINRVNLFAGNIRSEIPQHVMRRNRISYQNVEGWENEIKKFKEFFIGRDKSAYDHMREAFSLQGNLKLISISSNIKGLKSLKLRHSSFLFDKAEAKFFTDVPVSFEAVNVHPKYDFIGWKQFPNDTSRICVFNVQKIDTLQAIYKRKAFSQLNKKIRIFCAVKKHTKKDSLYLIGLMNVSGQEIENTTLMFKGFNQDKLQEFLIDSLNTDECFFITNNITEARKITTGRVRILQVNFPKGFGFSGREWVLFDKENNIIDSLLLNYGDSLEQTKKACFFYRDLKTNNWTPSKKFLSLEKVKQIVGNNTFNKILILISAIVTILALFVFILLRKRRNKNISVIFLLFLSFQFVKGQIHQTDNFGLKTLETKLVDNKGKGFSDLTGCRNVRVVLKNLLYRGGNNHAGSYQNPLELKTIQELKDLNFSRAIYLYEKNFSHEYPVSRIDSLRDSHFVYECSPVIDRKFLSDFMKEIKEIAGSPDPKLTYIHCWNGWHQSGRLSAMTLMQFCDFTPQMALKYWMKNTDGNYKGYKKVKESIVNFKRFDNLSFTSEQKLKYCPCREEMSGYSTKKSGNIEIQQKNLVKKNKS
ncbi:MAG: CotH kinase family protein [Bacteroidota bacterium]